MIWGHVRNLTIFVFRLVQDTLVVLNMTFKIFLFDRMYWFQGCKVVLSQIKNIYENLYVTKHRNISAKEGDRVAKSFSGDRSVSPLSNKLVFTKITIYLHPFISPCIGVPLRVHFSISSIHIVQGTPGHAHAIMSIGQTKYLFITLQSIKAPGGLVLEIQMNMYPTPMIFSLIFCSFYYIICIFLQNYFTFIKSSKIIKLYEPDGNISRLHTIQVG